MSQQVTDAGWDAFRNEGMLWWINRILHTFGWQIVMSYDENMNFLGAFPTRTANLGFNDETNERRLAQFQNRQRGTPQDPVALAEMAKQTEWG